MTDKARRPGVLKRLPELPPEARDIIHRVSKADIMEVAWHLASLCNDAASSDDNSSTRARLIEEFNTLRAGRGMKPLTFKSAGVSP